MNHERTQRNRSSGFEWAMLEHPALDAIASGPQAIAARPRLAVRGMPSRRTVYSTANAGSSSGSHSVVKPIGPNSTAFRRPWPRAVFAVTRTDPGEGTRR